MNNELKNSSAPSTKHSSLAKGESQGALRYFVGEFSGFVTGRVGGIGANPAKADADFSVECSC